MKKLMSFVCSVVIALTTIPFGILPIKADAAVFKGSGTANDPYQIASSDDLFKFAELINDTKTNPNYRNAYFIQTADIDLNGSNWIPIGIWKNWECLFAGSYDGNYHSISNYTLNYDNDFLGIFGRIGLGGNDYNDYCVVKNLSVYNSFDTSGTYVIGGIVGEVGYGASIENCSFCGELNAENAKSIGGIAGQIWCGGAIRACSHKNGIKNHSKHDNSQKNNIKFIITSKNFSETL